MKYKLIVVSLLGLFLELALIRWLPANIQSLAYFSNIVLIASFFGMGLGAILSKKYTHLFRWFPVTLLAVVGCVIALQFVEVIVPRSVVSQELVWSAVYTNNFIELAHIQLGIVPTLIIVYAMVSLLFVFIGQKIALLMGSFSSLRAYGFNVFGSILGIVLFGLLAFWHGLGSPTVWFAMVALFSVWLLRDERAFLKIGIGCMLIIIGVVHYASQQEIWSPYYSIHTRDSSFPGSIQLFVNRFFFQEMIDFKQDPASKMRYGLPYTLFSPRRVLILGAGTGNDVAIAALHGASHIDAVEIDSEILRIGRETHPNQPYQNPNVSVFVDDARSFLKKSDTKYDMIVLATLDSHALLSGVSTVRLDNYIYTDESFKDIKQHLTDSGVAVLMFSTPTQWLGEKLLGTVAAAFGSQNSLYYAAAEDSFLFNLMAIAGPGVPGIIAQKSTVALGFKPFPDTIDTQGATIATDDWPYVYLQNRGIPNHYLTIIAILLALSCAAILLVLPVKNMSWSNLNFGVLGGAFFLLETKAVTSLSLLFGSTWLVNAFVFASILTMIWFGNMLVSRFPIKRIEWMYALLALSLAMNYLVSPACFLGMEFWSRSLLSAFVVATPMFFSAIIFSYHFKALLDVRAMYGMNLLGAVFGGFLEYSSMAFGLRFLYILAGGLYVLSFISYKKSGQ